MTQEYVSYTSTAWVNGVQLQYAAEGRGRPIILLHGNSGSHHDLHLLQVQLAQAGYRVYALDSRGQGANAPLPEYHYADMAEDVYQFICNYNLHWPAIYGWSDGGITALLLELMHPNSCCLMGVSGINTHPTGVKDGVLPPIVPGYEQPPLIRMMQYEPDIKPGDLLRIQPHVMVTAGQYDAIKDEHTRFIADFLPHSELHILEGHDHGSYIQNSPIIGNLLIDFFRRHNFY